MTAWRTETGFTSWGRVLRPAHRVARPHWRDEIRPLLAGPERPASLLAVGLGRSYGDTCLNAGGGLVAMSGLDRLIAFDRETGVVRAEAGMSLDSLLRTMVPAGWFLPTAPGTRLVTLGGAVANDVHGKNHHEAGTFGANVTALALLRSDGARVTLHPGDPLFAATVGGLGLTGIIEWVEFGAKRIGSAYLDTESIAFSSVDEFFSLAEESASAWSSTMAWVDCASSAKNFGRGIFTRGRFAADGRLDPQPANLRTMPVDAPGFLLNPLTLRAFNSLFFRVGRARGGNAMAHFAPFFFPLDAIGDWNRLYGARGFYQHQCVIPPAPARAAVREMLSIVTSSGEGSFLAVLKTFGDQRSPGILSFPRAGATLALDFPNHGRRTLDVMAKLDSVVLEAGGSLYPAKDGRMSAAMFQHSYPHWRDMTAHIDPAFMSDFWRRVSQ